MPFSDLSPFVSHENFKWKYGETPLSTFQAIWTAWVIYGVVILVLKYKVMPNREPFKINYLVAIHNMILCIWSLLMFLLVGYQAIVSVSNIGPRALFCLGENEATGGVLQWGIYVFYVSKFYELFDTVILVLKKRPVIFLHWYHHVIVILMVFTWLEYDAIYCVCGLLFNTFVHVFMYYYYFLASLHRDTWFKKYITSVQIVQFVTSFALCLPYLYYYLYWENGGKCRGHFAVIVSMAINGTFLILFIMFFRKTYRNGRSKDSSSSTAEVTKKD